jgi:hypothetical protein
MALETVIGFVGVVIGSASTTVVTVYREQLVGKREREARQGQREQDRSDRSDAYQRENLLALQEAVSDMIKAVFNEQDRQLKEWEQAGKWPARTWETPTAVGWVDAEFRLQMFRARVSDKRVRDLAGDMRSLAMKSIWARTLHEAKVLNMPLEQNHESFHELVADKLSEPY